MFYAADLKRIRQDSQEMKPCCVENYAKSCFLSPVSMGLILVFTQLF